MKIAFHTVDLFSGRERLMPWRTVIEVSKQFIRAGHLVEVLSVIKEKSNSDYEYEGVRIKAMPNCLSEMVDYINQSKFDVFIFQVKWRDGVKKLTALSRLDCRKYAYFDGGVYRLNNVFGLIRTAGLATARPYLLECLIPKKMIARKLEKLEFSGVITLSDVTSATVQSAGFSCSTTVFPGNDFSVERPAINENPEGKYFLFTGSPHPARGIVQLLKAFDLFAKKAPDAKLILLMRTDVGSDFSYFEAALERLRHKSQVVVIRKNMSRDELKRYFSNAWSVMLPFLVIPSEMPLTFFEVLSAGTPVISFHNGGTTRYLSDALAISNRISSDSLSAAMEQVWFNEDLRNTLSENAMRLMSAHPTWEQSGNQWLQTITV